MSELISKQAVLASIKNLYPDMPIINIMGARRKWLEKYAPYFECEKAVEHLPSVENKGEWINETPCEDECSIYICSECGMSNLWESPFCPNCGADMRGK